jgi:hypothetical protein
VVAQLAIEVRRINVSFAETCAGKKVRVIGFGQEIHLHVMTEPPCRHPQVQQGSAAADGDLAGVRIDHWQKSGAVAVKNHGVSAYTEAPRLDIED